LNDSGSNCTIVTLKKLVSATDELAQAAALFELKYAVDFADEIVEIGRKLPGGSEIDFVTKGNVFVNVKNFDWSNREIN